MGRTFQKRGLHKVGQPPGVIEVEDGQIADLKLRVVSHERKQLARLADEFGGAGSARDLDPHVARAPVALGEHDVHVTGETEKLIKRGFVVHGAGHAELGRRAHQ